LEARKLLERARIIVAYLSSENYFSAQFRCRQICTYHSAFFAYITASSILFFILSEIAHILTNGVMN
jgi:hypothetical protein